MPMLYKILSDELGAESYLALAPSHLYIKHIDEQGKWVNIELTNGHFASDAWIMSSTEISVESIRKGVYMKELNETETIAFCMSDLTQCYRRQYKYDDFTLLCLQEATKYFPSCVNAQMHKYHNLREIGLAYQEKYGDNRDSFAEQNYKEFKAVDKLIDELGYRDMSPEAYEKWQNDMRVEKQKQASKNYKIN